MSTKGIRNLQAQPGYLHYAAEYPIDVHTVVSELADYEFLIGLIAMRSPKYKELFIQERRPDRYRIVDSGVFEDQENCPSALKLLEIALELDADEVVAVDVIGDRDGTLRAVDEFLSLEEDFPFKIMAVPQGANWEEWFDCYNEFIQNPRIDVIGVTYYKHPAGLEEVGIANFGIPNRYEAARLALLHLLAGGFNLKSTHNTICEKIRKPIHILGLGQLKAIRYYRQFPFVRSIDTSFPVQSAMEGRPLFMNAPKPEFKVNFSAEVLRAEKALIAENVFRFVRYCHGIDELEVWEVIDRLTPYPFKE